MKLKHISAAQLTLDTGEVITVEKIGKGMFHTVYADRAAGMVYAVTIERPAGDDYSKEILSHEQLGCGGTTNPHIPKVEYLGNIEGKDNRVYRMPLYFPLRAKHKAAWEQFGALMTAKGSAWMQVYREQVTSGNMRVTDIGHMVNQLICDIVDSPCMTLDIRNAVQELTDAASNYGASYCLEFSRKNCMVDGAGNLILLDCLFNLETVEKMQNQAVKKARGY